MDSQVGDSACTATAYLGGVKGNEGTIGVSAAVGRMDCLAMRNESNHVLSLAKWAQDAGNSSLEDDDLIYQLQHNRPLQGNPPV